MRPIFFLFVAPFFLCQYSRAAALAITEVRRDYFLRTYATDSGGTDAPPQVFLQNGALGDFSPHFTQTASVSTATDTNTNNFNSQFTALPQSLSAQWSGDLSCQVISSSAGGFAGDTLPTNADGRIIFYVPDDSYTFNLQVAFDPHDLNGLFIDFRVLNAPSPIAAYGFGFGIWTSAYPAMGMSSGVLSEGYYELQFGAHNQTYVSGIGSDHNFGSYNASFTVVPEPGPLGLVIAGAACSFLRRHRNPLNETPT